MNTPPPAAATQGGERKPRPRLSGVLVVVVCALGFQGERRMLQSSMIAARTTECVSCEQQAAEAVARALHLQQASPNNSSDYSETASQPAATLEDRKSGRLNLNYQPKSLGDGQRPSWETLEESGRKPLNFLHIPKTGGSSILRLSASQGFTWADCMFPSSWGKKICPDYNSTSHQNWPKHPHDAPWWHTPVQYLDKSQPNPYDGYDLFAVVRNPYERAVSEYYYYCKFHKKACFGGSNQKEGDTAERLNAKLQDILMRVLGAPQNTADYYVHWGHWIPQYDYFFDTTITSGNNNKPRRIVKHLLHNENLNAEFDSLMAAYQLNLTLPAVKAKSRTDLGAQLGVEHLTVNTMKLIEVVFERDFALGGYEMLSGKVQALEEQQ